MRRSIYIALRLLTCLAALGCATAYACLWRALELPIDWSVPVVCVLAGVLTIWGLVYWLTRQE